MRTCLYLFQQNLRVEDNPSLYYAYENFGRIVPVVVVPQYAYTHLKGGKQEMGRYRKQFMLESIAALQFELLKNDIELIVLYEDENLAQNLQEICEQHHIHYTVTSYPRGIYRGNLLGILCQMAAVFTCEDDNLISEEALPFNLKKLPKSFTSFRYKIEKYIEVRELCPAPQFKKYHNTNNFGVKLTVKPLARHPHAAYPVQGGEDSGRQRLNYYLWGSENITKYKEMRNEMIGSEFSSKFSGYLAQGCLSPVQIYHALQDFEENHTKNESTYWMFLELLWREYLMLVGAKHGAKLFQLGGIQDKKVRPENNMSNFKKWCQGKTAHPFINACMKELVATGYMSNRGRQNVASYLVHHLKVDWRLGAAFFEKYLIDYDVSINWGNWMYLAGVGNDPRERVFNPDRQQERYDKDRAYTHLWNETLS